MLTSGFKEEQEKIVSLKHASAESIKDLVDYSYSGVLTRKTNVMELASLAHQCEIEPLLAQCLTQLVSTANEYNVVELLKTLKLYSAASFEARSIWEVFKRRVIADQSLCLAALEELPGN